MSYINEVVIKDKTTGDTMSIDSNGHGDVVAHTHPEGGSLHFVSDDLTASTDFILADLSDTTNYPHDHTTALHVGWILFSVDAPTNAKFKIQFGFIDNVDGTNGDFHEIHSMEVAKATIIPAFNMFPIAPDGIYATAGKYITSINELNDTAFNTATNLRSTLSPTTAVTPAGNGDLVLRFTHDTGTIKITFDLNYHSH